ncbi:hypothetical protein DFP72DRAFT_273625 [Ephemerocybe angulata]|uniref:Uncharacterized protein n=1 Tax=Ephemerocybe angulata TaxID=980116 RepID=A0A8H6I0X6_9AGAR|nr:hypothetical protein DFP72DRAFT_273625 [Tulosesus angulatus]
MHGTVAVTLGDIPLAWGTSLAGSLAYMCAGARTDQRVSPLLLTTGHTGCHTIRARTECKPLMNDPASEFSQSLAFS